MSLIRIEKYIADITALTRKQVKQKISKNCVKVNGEILKKSVKVDPEKDKILLDDALLKYEKYQYFMFNKPAGFVCANFDKTDSTIFDISGLERNKYFSFGRLDKDTEGLLIISNDGKLCHDLLSPKNKIPKKYFVKVDKDFGSKILNHKDPIHLSDCVIKDYVFDFVDDRTCFLTIYEGKFHQIKKMMSYFGLNVIYLKRISFGKLSLDFDLKPGEIKKLSLEEVELLKQK